MRALTVRNLSDSDYKTLAELASKKGRSLQQQVKIILERECRFYQLGAGHRAKEWRRRLKSRDWGKSNIVSDIREEREKR